MGEWKLANIKYSLEEYLAIDTQSEDRYEYESGHIWAMAGTSTNHNRIVLNTALVFKSDIKNNKRKCDIFTESVRLEVSPKQIYYYPDLIFTCNAADLQEKITLASPSLVIEVLSESSFSMDLSQKLDNYIKMPSLIYYLVISQDEYRIRVWEKVGNRWIYAVYTELSDIVDLNQIQLSLLLAEVYENVSI